MLSDKEGIIVRVYWVASPVMRCPKGGGGVRFYGTLASIYGPGPYGPGPLELNEKMHFQARNFC